MPKAALFLQSDASIQISLSLVLSCMYFALAASDCVCCSFTTSALFQSETSLSLYPALSFTALVSSFICFAISLAVLMPPPLVVADIDCSSGLPVQYGPIAPNS